MKPFWKYHAIGNDFIIMDEADFVGLDPVQLCDRHKGIGADGVLIYRPHDAYVAEMHIINSDGSIAQMCGNGLRCFAHWLRAKKGVKEESFTVLTGRGPLLCSLEKDDAALVELGSLKQESRRQTQINYNGIVCDVFMVNVGNDHLVVVPMYAVSEESACDIAEHIKYPAFYDEEVNVEVVYKVDQERRFAHTVVHERGVGFTLGCGTGAAAIYSVLSQDGASWDIEFPGGIVQLSGDVDDSVMLKGDVVFLYYGELHE